MCFAYQSKHKPGPSSNPGGRNNLGAGSAHPAMLMNLFDSHDTARALWMLRGDASALKLLTLMQQCVPGPPMMYQGTEVGQTGALGLEGSGRDPHNRQAFPWHSRDSWNQDILNHTKKMGVLRNGSLALRRGGLRWRDVFERQSEKGDTERLVNDPKLIVWERFFDRPGDGPNALCVFHADTTVGTETLFVETGFGPEVAVKTLFASNDETIIVGKTTDSRGRVAVKMGAQSGLVVGPA